MAGQTGGPTRDPSQQVRRRGAPRQPHIIIVIIIITMIIHIIIIIIIIINIRNKWYSY